MTRSTLARSLALVAMGLALSLPVALTPVLAQAHEHERRGAAGMMQHSAAREQQSGAADLLIAYENTLMAHMDASLGHNDLAQGHLNVARQHLEHANRLLGGSITTPGTTERGRMRGGGGGPEEQGEGATRTPDLPLTESEDEEMRGGGGGPTAAGPLGNLETMMRTTEEDLNAENTNRLVAAFTNELSRLSRIGGGGGPGAPRGQALANRITSLEYFEMAYAATGKAAGSTAIQDWDEARNSIDDAKRHLDQAKKAPGNEALRAQLERADKALKDAEGPIRGRSAQASEATARAIRELTMAISSLPQAQPQTETRPGGTRPGGTTPGGTSR